MPNFAISDMAPITLPLDPANTFFETEAIEGGISVSRKIAASDLGIGGSVLSVNSGLNVTVDNTDPLNPIVNLEASIAPVDVNGVTLTNVGAATNFLNETGAYSVPPGAGQVDSVVGGINITVNAADPLNPIVDLDAVITGMTVNGVVLSDAGAATSYLDETGAYSVPPAGGGQVDSIVAGTAITVNAGDPVNPTVNFDTTAPLTFFAQMQFQNAVRLRYTTAAADSPGVGQIHASADDIFFVDDNGVSTSMIAAGGGQVDSVVGGTNVSVNAGDPVNPIVNLDAAITGVSVDGVTLSAVGAATNYLDETGAYSIPPSGAPSDPLILGSINLTSALSAATLGAPYTNVPLNIGANLVGTQGMTQMSRQRIQTKPSAFSFNSTLFINTDGAGTAGSDTFIGGLNSANIEVEFGVAVRFQHGSASTVVAETTTPAAGGFLANNLATGAGLERVLTTADLGGGGSPFLTPLLVNTVGNVAVGGNQTARVGITRLDATPLADLGFFGTPELEMKSYSNGGRFRMKLNNTAGT